ncbi:hypothetical protein CC1G_15641 [Coprinopsis cinerea okayama7|uniref:Uncharacterized protein n=1 Tax=Coprinopsis cinerea (strain Okayama-7 / 130 / ATCC MYA-4618 / FGSC 9003) TaxID=240176 RepID=D6RQA4_COPC7|nr:hypothetical protein CC1G_15641 [Coprinopsis cinerea okayama7\|eukprot:XP_002910214.1 hypothetical protein CC1G_15641 [Coprinopsis cinerea okayama7\
MTDKPQDVPERRRIAQQEVVRKCQEFMKEIGPQPLFLFIPLEDPKQTFTLAPARRESGYQLNLSHFTTSTPPLSVLSKSIKPR